MTILLWILAGLGATALIFAAFVVFVVVTIARAGIGPS